MSGGRIDGTQESEECRTLCQGHYELEIGKKTDRVAEVEPMDVDGVRTMTVGTIVWGIIAFALLPFLGTLEDDGRTWWLWTAPAGSDSA